MSENHTDHKEESQENSKPSYWAVIPAHVRYCKEIEMGAKVLYAEISCLANTKGYCWASNRYFADLYDVSESTVKRWISSLQESELIIIETVKKGVLWDRKIWTDPLAKKMFTKAQKRTFEGSKLGLRRPKNEPIIEKEITGKQEEIVCAPVAPDEKNLFVEEKKNAQDEKIADYRKIIKHGFNGKTHCLCKNDVIEYSIQQRNDWTSKEILDAWEVLLVYSDPIRDAFKFIEGTIKNNRKIQGLKSYETQNKVSTGSQKERHKGCNLVNGKPPVEPTKEEIEENRRYLKNFGGKKSVL